MNIIEQMNNAQAVSPINWQKPSPIIKNLPIVESFESELLPEPLRDWIIDISLRKDNAPADYAAVGTMVALGSLLGRKIGIYPKRHDDWLVVPNLWGVIIGRPSMKKTPTLNEAFSPIRKLEADSKREYEEDKEDFQVAAKLQQLIQQEEETNAKKAVKKGNISEAETILLRLEKEAPEPPTRKRILINDATVEKLGEILSDNPNGILQFRDELSGWLSGLDREDKAQDRGFYLESWNGTGRFTYDRIGRGTVDIESATVSVMGGIQPGKLYSYMRSMVEGSGDDGLIQRLQLMVYPDQGEFKHVDRLPDLAAKNTAHQVFQQFSQIPENDGKIPGLKFNELAQSIFDEWYTEFTPRIRKESDHHIEAHLSKYPSLMASIALIIHVSEHGPTGDVSEKSALKALAWCEYLESHARRVYSLVIDTTCGAKSLVSRLGNLNNPFKIGDINNKGWSSLKNTEEIKRALDTLCQHGYLHAIKEKTSTKPKTFYYIHPDYARKKS
mgnify:CR=1 FL=1